MREYTVLLAVGGLYADDDREAARQFGELLANGDTATQWEVQVFRGTRRVSTEPNTHILLADFTLQKEPTL